MKFNFAKITKYLLFLEMATSLVVRKGNAWYLAW